MLKVQCYWKTKAKRDITLEDCPDTASLIDLLALLQQRYNNVDLDEIVPFLPENGLPTGMFLCD